MFGQYSIEDIALAPGGDVWAGSIYVAPQSVVASPSSSITSELLPTLTSIVKAAVPAVSSYFQYSAQKEAAKSGTSLKAGALQAPTYTRPTALPASIAGLPVSTWMLVGGGTVAALLLLRGRRQKGGGRRRRR